MTNETINSASCQTTVVGSAVKIRIAWNRGKRKPIADEDGVLWCNCKFPRLTSQIGRGQAFCLLCKTPWYH